MIKMRIIKDINKIMIIKGNCWKRILKKHNQKHYYNKVKAQNTMIYIAIIKKYLFLL